MQIILLFLIPSPPIDASIPIRQHHPSTSSTSTKFIGASTHSLAEAKAAELSGAELILFGPVYFTPSKAAYGKPQGLIALKEIVEKISSPVYAIGGIKPENIEEAKQRGIRGVALISAIMSADNPKEATQRILRQLKR